VIAARRLQRVTFAVAAVLLLAVLWGASTATAGQAWTVIPFKANVDSTIVYENEEGVSIEVGSMQSAQIGRGAVIIRFGSAGEAEGEAEMTIYTSHGTIRARTRVTREEQADGTSKGTGFGTVSGGSQGFQGSRGTFGIVQTVIPGQDTGPPPGTDPGEGPPPGEGGPGGGTETHFTMDGELLIKGPPGSVTGQHAFTKRFDAELRAGELQFAGEGTGTFVGEFLSDELGDGVTVYTTKGEGVTGERTGTMSIWTANGRIEIRLRSTFTEQPDGTIVNNGTGTIVGGSHLYRKARGQFTVFASLDPDNPAPYTSVQLSNGRITVP
jgi:hypothetical protein